MADVQPTTPQCEHRRLQPGSGGYYVMCIDCQQTWVARRRLAARDDDFDRAPSLTCMTPLAGQGGRWEWTP